MKICCLCKSEKPLEEFYRDQGSPDGRKRDCIECRKAAVRAYYKANRDQIRARQRPKTNRRLTAAELERQREQRATPEGKRKMREARLRTAYGMSVAEFDRLAANQAGVCAICKREPSGRGATPPRLYVDHDHVTGAVRGLLCHSCNTGLGHLRDDRDRLLAAIEYLRRSGLSE